MTRDMWMDAVDNAGEEYQSGAIGFDEAVRQLIRIGLDHDEAETMLKEHYS